MKLIVVFRLNNQMSQTIQTFKANNNIIKTKSNPTTFQTLFTVEFEKFRRFYVRYKIRHKRNKND